jgi:hypothetical protein
MHLIYDRHRAHDRGADDAGLTRLAIAEAMTVNGRRRITSAESMCDDWAYWLEDDGFDGIQVGVLFKPTGQIRTMPGADIDVGRAWTANGARRDLFVDAVEMLAADFALPEQRAAAVAAVHHLDVLTAICVCGGYLALMPGRQLRHVDVCDTCLTHPDQCTDAADRRARHPMYNRPRFEGEPALCEVAEAVLCEHCCRRTADYEATRGCGAGLRCCGGHDCDTAEHDRQATMADPFDGATLFVAIPAPAVPELRVVQP